MMFLLQERLVIVYMIDYVENTTVTWIIWP